MAFSSPYLAFFFLFITISQISPSKSAKCSSQSFVGKKVYVFCTDLPDPNTYIHWIYNDYKSTLSIAFIAPPASPSGWVSWAINPPGKDKSQALIAYKNARDEMEVNTYVITSYGQLKQSDMWFEVLESAADCSNGFIRIFCTMVLPSKGLKKLNHTWQVGASVSDGVPDINALQWANSSSMGKLYLFAGNTHGRGESDFSGSFRTYIHGGLNLVSWGILYPMAFINEMCMRNFLSFWYNLHFLFQFLAFIFGFQGWIIGLLLGSESNARHFSHGHIGTSLFVISAVQVAGLYWKPKRNHEYWHFWNIFHRGYGCITVFLGIINVYLGLNILKPKPDLKPAYSTFLGVLGCIVVILEVMKRSCSLVEAQDAVNNEDNSGYEEISFFQVIREEYWRTAERKDDTSASGAVGGNQVESSNRSERTEAEAGDVPAVSDLACSSEIIEAQNLSENNPVHQMIKHFLQLGEQLDKAKMKSSGTGLVNASRGSDVDEDDAIMNAPRRAHHRRSATVPTLISEL